jgi:hypothetical protein
VSAESKDARSRKEGFKFLDSAVENYRHFVPVVTPGSTQVSVINAKAQPADEMQGRGRCGAQASYVARIWRDLRLPERDMQQMRFPLRGKRAPLTPYHF